MSLIDGWSRPEDRSPESDDDRAFVRFLPDEVFFPLELLLELFLVDEPDDDLALVRLLPDEPDDDRRVFRFLPPELDDELRRERFVLLCLDSAMVGVHLAVVLSLEPCVLHFPCIRLDHLSGQLLRLTRLTRLRSECLLLRAFALARDREPLE
jgi:hypothetical protein